MPALRPIVAYQESGNRPLRKRYKLAAAAVFHKGDFVVLDGSEEVVEVAGADPTSFLGIAAENAANVIEAGFVMVEVFNADTILRMQGTSVPTEDNVNQLYGIVEDGDGVYVVDVTETGTTCFYVVDVDIPNAYFFVKVLDANRQVHA